MFYRVEQHSLVELDRVFFEVVINVELEHDLRRLGCIEGLI